MDIQKINNLLDQIRSEVNKVEDNTVKVKPGDNIQSLVDNNIAGTIFDIDSLFAQDVGRWTINKPCIFKGNGGAIFNNAAITCAAPDIQFHGLNMNGNGENIIITDLRTMVSLCRLYGNSKGQHRGILVNSEGVRILSSSILNIFSDQDTQAIGGSKGTKDLAVINCDLEASGENIIFGGDYSLSEDRIPQDILIDTCHMFKNPIWHDNSKITTKNLFELKNAKRVTLRNSILEYSWPGGGQAAFGIVLTVRNNGNKEPWSIIEDILIEDNKINHVGSGVQILGRDDSASSQVMNLVTLQRNKFNDINNKIFGGRGYSVAISGGPRNLTLEENEYYGTNINSALAFDQPQFKLENFGVNGDNYTEGNYGIFGTGASAQGKVVLDMYAPGYTWNAKVRKSGVRKIAWPDGTVFI